MAKTKKLRIQLQTKLTAALTAAQISGKVFYSYAPKDASRPYVIFSLEEITREDGRITYELEINCVDYGRDTDRCEDMADTITAALDHTVTITEDIEFHIYANRRNNVSADDVNIIRRRLTFDLYLYERTE